jgi:hypothetical protein
VTAGEPAARPASPTWLVERYEELRRGSLAGQGEGSRLGLTILLHQGVTAWSRAWEGLAKACPAASRGPATPPVTVAPSVVSLLACMTLAVSGAPEP